MATEDLLAGLNKSQLQAVTHKTGPLLIIAGAGTGKTTVITRRIANLIANKLARPSEILALTFTDKAAGEMEERVDQLVPYGFVDTWISTFNAFGDRILREFALDLGLPANFKVLSATEQAIFMRENIYSFDLKHFRPLANPIGHIEALLNHFSRLKDELVTPEEYKAFVESKKFNGSSDDEALEHEKELELAGAYERYQELMIQAGNLDYGDQIYLTYRILKENKKVLTELQGRFKYILVDEFQDTNYAQYQIVKLLGGNNPNITVVGDDDQSIYRFRGASISNILSFKDDYKDCTQIVLNQNYRSTQEILDSSYKLIQHNNPDRLEVQNKIDKRLIANKKGEYPELIHCETLSCEADKVAQIIEDLVKEKSYKYNDFAILARANSHLEPFIQSLNVKNIPSIFVGTSSLFARPEIKMLVSFFKCLVYPDDNLSFFNLATSELYKIDVHKLSAVYATAKRQNRSFEDIFESENIESDIKKIIDDLNKFREKLKSNYSAGEILYEYLKEKQYFKSLSAAATVEAEIKVSNIAKFFDRISQFDHVATDKSVHSFLNNLEMIVEVGDEVKSSDIDPDLDAVNMMTVHSAKGLEWPVVFVVNLVNERFPTRRRSESLPIPNELIKERLPEGDFHIQEERRLFYVGVTRAKDRLYLTSADDYGGKRAKKLSQFVLELLDDANIAKIKHKQSALEKIEKFQKVNEPTIKVRDKNLKKTGQLYLSRQQIDDYYTCPKKYYFVNVVKVPLPTDWHFMYGSAIHETLQRYFAKKQKAEKPDLESMILDFNTYFKNEGFITRQQEELRQQGGIETLARFYDHDQKENLMPDMIEEKFEFAEDNLKINGRYDLVIKNKEGVEILDFKTSEVKDQKDADRRIRESTQMKIYALAWFEKYGEIPQTTLSFIESDKKGSRKFKQADLEKTREMILDVAEGIRSEDYTAKPDKRKCKWCPYKFNCPDAIN